MTQFGMSQPVRRREDPRLLTGAGRFLDDRTPEGCVHAYLVRSPHAHARVLTVNAADARALPGVLAIYTASDLAEDGVGSLVCVALPPGDDVEFRERRQPLLAADRVRYVGEAVALVVAETPAIAQDAAEQVLVDYDPLPATADTARCTAPDAAPVWDEAPDNVSFRWDIGDEAATREGLEAAARVVHLTLSNNRVVVHPLELRGAVGEFDAGTGRYTLVTTTQMPHGVRNQLAGAVLGVPVERLRVRVHDVGGGFGGRNSPYPEQGLVLFAARRLERPVKWVASRGECFLTDFAGRDQHSEAELGLDSAGRFLALRVRTVANLGAYTATRGPVSPTNVHMASNVYRIPGIHVEVTGAFTHTVPTDPYRGAGRPEILYLLERLVDVAAAETGIDRVELRRRNLIPLDAFPYRVPTGLVYDPCDFEDLLDAALERADWTGIEARRAESAGRGLRRGIGLNLYVERCGGGAGFSESAAVRFERDASLTVCVGSMSNGQGHETAFSQIVSERLGLPFERIRIVQGDTDTLPQGTGTGGSWSITMGGAAITVAMDGALDQARQIAAERLEAAEGDLEFRRGAFVVAGTDLAIGLDETVALSFDEAARPPGVAPGLAADARFSPDNFTFPFGCHLCEVEVDPQTGATRLLRYTAVHDFGRALNPLLLAGQVHGGVAQGIGQALLEQVVHDDEGQLLSGSLMDYALPRADDLPDFDFVHRQSPSPNSPLGVKGCGEAGAAGPPPALVNAVVDALREDGIEHLDMPLSPGRVWSALRDAR
jgi:carbon-monoxide dehydrogenase large subunit